MISDLVTAIGITLTVTAALAVVIVGGYAYLTGVNDWIGVVGGVLGLFIIMPAFGVGAIVAAWLAGRYAGQPLGGIVSVATSALVYVAAGMIIKAAAPAVSPAQRRAFDERSERTRQECLDAGENASALCKEFLRRFPQR